MIRHESWPGFIDWLKAIGITLIIFGHLAGWGGKAHYATAPIYYKQIGVALFMLALGFTLAREQRPISKVLFNRHFEIYLFGIASAIAFSSVSYFANGNPAESNYLPFLFGANVLFDFFPANPSTWYIGTYLHALLAWAFFLRGVRIRPWMIALCVAVEIPTRAVLMAATGPFVAYMALPNWATVFLLGLYLGLQPELDCGCDVVRRGRSTLILLFFVAVWVSVAMTLPLVGGPLPPLSLAFPFVVFDLGSNPLNLLATSAAVTLLYAATSWLVAGAVRGLPVPSAVLFLARNTLLIFLLHMPVSYAMEGLQIATGSRWESIAVRLLVGLPVLAITSEVIRRMVRPARLRDRLWSRLVETPAAPAATTT